MRTILKFQSGASDILWAILLILLPVTSMPAVRDLLHISVIAGPSVLALAALLIIWLLPYLFKGGGMPREILPLFGFVLAVLLSISATQFLTIPTYKDTGMIRPAVSACITLLVGLGYLLLTYSRLSTEVNFRKTLKWIYIGGFIMIVWSLMQSSAWFIGGRYPAWMRDVQDVFSLGPLYRQRTSGFALEPSWLAHMLNMLYLPMWLAASFNGYSIFSFRILKKISVENDFSGAGNFWS